MSAEPRFYVRELTGVPILARGQVGQSNEKTSYYVIDRLYNCAVIRTFENSPDGWHYPRAELRRRAERYCGELNEAWLDELRRG